MVASKRGTNPGWALLWVVCANPCGAQLVGPEWTRHTIDNAALGADGVRTADLNKDGLPDLVVAWEFSGAVRIALNPGECAVGTLWPSATVANINYCEDVLAVDLDGDGWEDLVTCAERHVQKVYVHWSPGDRDTLLSSGAWVTQQFTAAPALRWMYSASMQIDGDHGPDIVIASKTNNTELQVEIGWLRAPANPRDASQWTYHRLSSVGWVTAIESCDMDGDGDDDVLVFDRLGTQRGVWWLENPGTGSPAQLGEWTRRPVQQGFPATIGALADIDGDGLRDIAAPAHPSSLYWFEALDSSGRKWESTSILLPSLIGRPKAASVGDIDLDGRADIVLSTTDADGDKRGVIWLRQPLNPQSPFWTANDVSGPAGEKFDSVPLLDLDGDGDLDIIVTEEFDNAGSEAMGLVWYENPTIQLGSNGIDLTGDGFVNFSDLVLFLDFFNLSGPGLAADFNGDGAVNFADLNLLLAGYNQPIGVPGCDQASGRRLKR